MLISLRKKILWKCLASSCKMLNSELEVQILKIQIDIGTNPLYSTILLSLNMTRKTKSHCPYYFWSHKMKGSNELLWHFFSDAVVSSLITYMQLSLFYIRGKHRRFSIINTKVCQNHFALMNLKIFYHFSESNYMLLGWCQV